MSFGQCQHVNSQFFAWEGTDPLGEAGAGWVLVWIQKLLREGDLVEIFFVYPKLINSVC